MLDECFRSDSAVRSGARDRLQGDSTANARACGSHLTGKSLANPAAHASRFVDAEQHVTLAAKQKLLKWRVAPIARGKHGYRVMDAQVNEPNFTRVNQEDQMPQASMEDEL